MPARSARRILCGAFERPATSTKSSSFTASPVASIRRYPWCILSARPSSSTSRRARRRNWTLWVKALDGWSCQASRRRSPIGVADEPSRRSKRTTVEARAAFHPSPTFGTSASGQAASPFHEPDERSGRIPSVRFYPLGTCSSRSAGHCIGWREGRQAAHLLDEAGDLADAAVFLEVGEQERPAPTHLAGIAVHDLEARADDGSEIGLVDGPRIGAR